MKKFSQINESNTTVEQSTNKKDFIKNLVNESLSVENGEIKGKESLVKTLNKILDINDAKTTIRVLENVKARSFHNFSFEWINEAIVAEKKKCDEKECEKEEGCCKECKCDPCECEKEVKESLQTLNENHIDKLEEFEEEGQHEDDEHEESEHEEHGDIKSDLEEIKEIQLEILDKLEGGNPADGFVDPDEEELIVDEEECENCEDEEECEECEDMFVEENASYMKDIRDLVLLTESIKSGLVTEDHLENKDEQLDYILSRFTDKKVEKVVVENISSLPTYVKTADIEETLKNLSDAEVKKLYLEVEKVK